MKVTLLKLLRVSDGSPLGTTELVIRKDTQLPAIPRPESTLTLLTADGKEAIDQLLRSEQPVYLVEGAGRVVVWLSDLDAEVSHKSDAAKPNTLQDWLQFFVKFGFLADEGFTGVAGLTPWSVVGVSQKSPSNPSPCCGTESGHVASIGTAYIYQCGLCGQRFHYSGGRAVPGLPHQEEPGAKLDPAFEALDPTTPVRGSRTLWPGVTMAKLNPDAGHGAGDGFGGSDYPDGSP